MSAPVVTELAVTFPVLVLEGAETSDGRYIEPGALTHRALPFPVLAQTRNPDGGYGHDGADVIGRIDFIERVPGPEVISRETGKPFDEGVFVWRGRGAIDATHEASTLLRAGFLTGNSVDIVDCDVRYEWPEDDGASDDDGGLLLLFDDPGREVMTSGVIGATTLVPIPAFADAHVVIDSADFAVRARPQLAALAVAGEKPWPAWRAVAFTQVGGRVTYDRRTPVTRPAGPQFAVRHAWDDVPVAAQDTPWDVGTALGALRARATRADGTLDPDLYADGFLYRADTTDGQAVHAAYRMPVCTVSELGDLVIVPAAVQALSAGLDSTDLVGEQAEQVRAVLSDLHLRLGVPAPWEVDDEATEGAAVADIGRTLLAVSRELSALVRMVTRTSIELTDRAEQEAMRAEHRDLLAQLRQ